jgi:hypothetical protein
MFASFIYPVVQGDTQIELVEFEAQA